MSEISWTSFVLIYLMSMVEEHEDLGILRHANVRAQRSDLILYFSPPIFLDVRSCAIRRIVLQFALNATSIGHINIVQTHVLEYVPWLQTSLYAKSQG